MRFFIVVFAFFPLAGLADEYRLGSAVTNVTLYPQGASIMRMAAYDIQEGKHTILVTDLPVSTPLDSIRVTMPGVQIHEVTARNALVRADTTEESDAFKAAEARVEHIKAELTRAEAKAERLELAEQAAHARIGFLETLGQNETLANLTPDTLGEFLNLVDTETLNALLRAQEARLNFDAAVQGLEALREDLADAQKDLAALAEGPRQTAMLEISVTAADTVQGNLEISYAINDAGWTPVYDFRLQRAQEKMLIERGAMVFQNTGENWDDTAVRLSTSRPSSQTRASEMFPWLRRIEDPEPVFTKRTLQSADSFDLAEESMAEPLLATTAVAQTDGIVVAYDVPEAVSVTSGVDRVRLALAPLERAVKVKAVAVPLFDDRAFLQASFTNADEPLLATAAASFFVDGRFVGRRYSDFYTSGQDVSMDFGPIDTLRLRRLVRAREESDQGLISKSNAETQTIELEVENLSSEKWDVTVMGRVPYSEQEDLKIKWKAQPEPARIDANDKKGVLAWDIVISPQNKATIEIKQEIIWPDGKVLR